MGEDNGFKVSLAVRYNNDTIVYSSSTWEPTVKLYNKLGPSPRWSFSRVLQSTFNHEKCLGCHAFQTNALGTRHVSINRIPNTNGSTISNSGNCSGCHNRGNGYADGWRAPVGMDWTALNAAQTVEMITEPPFDSKTVMRNHLKNDPLIQWAIKTMPRSKRSSWRRNPDRWVKSWKGTNRNP